MDSANLQKSELIISKILEKLLSLGLQQGSELKFKDLGLPDEDQSFFNGCCHWLLEEQIIRCEEIAQSMGGPAYLLTPMITSRGFALLDQPFVGTAGATRVGQAVKEVAEGTRNYAGIGDLVGGILGGFTKSIGSG